MCMVRSSMHPLHPLVPDSGAFGIATLGNATFGSATLGSTPLGNIW